MWCSSPSPESLPATLGAGDVGPRLGFGPSRAVDDWGPSPGRRGAPRVRRVRALGGVREEDGGILFSTTPPQRRGVNADQPPPPRSASRSAPAPTARTRARGDPRPGVASETSVKTLPCRPPTIGETPSTQDRRRPGAENHAACSAALAARLPRTSRDGSEPAVGPNVGSTCTKAAPDLLRSVRRRGLGQPSEDTGRRRLEASPTRGRRSRNGPESTGAAMGQVLSIIYVRGFEAGPVVYRPSRGRPLLWVQ